MGLEGLGGFGGVRWVWRGWVGLGGVRWDWGVGLDEVEWV